MTAQELSDDELLDEYGSPLYVYDTDRLARSARDLYAALPVGAEVLYSLKANPHPGLVAALRAAGCGAEVSSTGELAAAIEAGFDAGDCFYSGPGKTVGELTESMTAGVRTFSVESLVDLRRVGSVAARLGVVAECLLRVNGSGAEGGAGLRMTGTASQFGIDIATVSLRPEDLAVPGAHVVGMHFFPLTNAANEDDLVAEIDASVRAAKELALRWGIELRILDLGGGFACPYAVPGERPTYPGLRAAVDAILAEHFPDWRAEGLRVVFESGRYLVGDSGRLLCTVMDVKRSRENTYAVLDTGVNHIGGMSGIGRLLPLSAKPIDGSGVPSAEDPGTRISLVGPLCTPADVVSRGVALTGLVPDQRLVIPNVGAYGVTASLIGFLSRPTPGEVLVAAGKVISASRLHLNRTAINEHQEGEQTVADEWDSRYEKVLVDVLPRLGNVGGVDAGTNLRAVGLDSMTTVEILVRLEEAYNIRIPDEALQPETFRTPGDLWSAVHKQVSEQG
jgi:diaminopimelate decarboxylase